jgi:PAS domain S-box-containing protein
MEQSDWRLLLIEDDDDDYILVRQMLSEARRGRFKLVWARSAEEGRAELEANTFDAVLVDNSIGLHSGVDLIREAVAREHTAPFLLLTGQGSYDIDVEAMEAGASDYLSKSEINPQYLERAIRYAMERKRNEQIQRANETLLRQTVNQVETLNAINTQVIKSPKSDEMIACILQMASTAMNADGAHIIMFDEQQMPYPLLYNLPQDLISREYSENEKALMNQVLKTGEPLIFDKNQMVNEELNALAENLGIDNALLLPLYTNGRVSGVLGFHWTGQEWAASPDEIDFAQKLAASLSLSINKLRLFQNMQAEIDERKRIEAELRVREGLLRLSEAHYQESERRFRQTFENAAVGIAHVDFNGRFIRVNQSLADITGYSKAELLQMTFQEITHPDDLEADLEQAQRLSAGEIENYTLEKRYRQKDGSYIWVDLTGSMQNDANGKPECFIAVIQDITLKKKAEQSLRESEQYVRRIIDTLFTFVGVLTVDGVLIEANNAPLQAAGITRKDVYGKPFEQTYWWNYAPEVQARVRQAIKLAAEGKSSRFDIDVRVAGNRLMPIDFMIAPMRDDNGNILYLIPSAVDITRRKRMEQSLRESEERFRIALTSVPIFVYNMDTDLRYTWVHNPQTGFTSKQMLGKTDAEIFPGEIGQMLSEEKRIVLQNKESVQKEYKLMLNGDMKHFLISNSPLLDAAGEITGLVGSAYDVTQQRQIEAQKIEYTTNMEVQRRLIEYREKERQGIAREIHDGPIQSLVSTIFNIQVVLDAVENEGVRLELEQIRDSMKTAVRELRDTINELRPPLLIRFGLARAIRVHAEDFRDKQPEIKLHLELDDDSNKIHEEICLALYRIYQEGLNNIVRHARASEVWVRLKINDAGLKFELSDDGKGFSGPGNLAQLIQEGHYGLAGMRERAEGIGGRFEVTSIPDKGTTISVTVMP